MYPPEPQQTYTIGQGAGVYSRSHSSHHALRATHETIPKGRTNRLSEQVINHRLDPTAECQPQRPLYHVPNDVPDSFRTATAATVLSGHLPPSHQNKLRGVLLSQLLNLPAFSEAHGDLAKRLWSDQDPKSTYSRTSPVSPNLPAESSRHCSIPVHPPDITKKGSDNTAAAPNVDHGSPTTNCFTPVNFTTTTDNKGAKSAVCQPSHSRYHPYPIRSCQVNSFIREEYPARHMVVDSSETRYYCPHGDCERGEHSQGFKDKTALKRHARVHGPPKHICHTCPNQIRYKYPYSLKRYVPS